MSGIDLSKAPVPDHEGTIETEEVPPTYQFRALSRKNAALQVKDWKSNCCQILIPLVLVCVAGGIQLLFNVYVTGSFEGGTFILTKPSLQTFNDGEFSGGNDTYRWEDYNIWHAEPQWSPTIGNLTQLGGKAGMLGEITQFVNTSDTSGVTTYTPWYYYYDQGEQAMLDEIESLKEYWVQVTLANQQIPICYTCPFAANVFNSVEIGATPTDPHHIDYQVLTETQLIIDRAPFDEEHTMMNMVNTAFLRYATQNANWTISMWSQPLPYVEQAPSFDIGSFLGLLLYPFAVSFVLAIYVNAIVVEKQERLREMMRMMGLKMSWYWFVYYIWDFLLYALIIVMMIVTSIIFQLRMFTQTSFILWIVILVGWGNAQIAMGFLLSTFFNKARTASVVAYILVIAGVIFSYVLNATVFKQNSDNPLVYTIFFLYPPFACYRAIYLIGAGCTVLQCPQISEIKIGGELFWIMIFLYLDTIVYLLVALYLDAVIPREFGVAKHPLFPIKNLIRWIKRKRMKATSEEDQTILMVHDDFEDTEEHVALNDELTKGGDELEEDPDVTKEAERIRTHQIPSSSPIVIQNLRKVYKKKAGTPEKIAVQNLSFHVEKGECFGLLGPNGAGKTTTISILTGLFAPTSGNALIGGFSILEDMDKIHRIMSVCPQFDTVWMSLTCRETLLFYARLKGISSKEEKSHVASILDKVGLSQYATRKASDLSGGMRRRLSIGISLVGNPRVVFLDEPTTGLDPETRRHLWDVLLEVKKGRCIILTTHSMEEADILCSRIGIMTRGRLMCLGTQLHLKNKFGEGYTLHVNFSAHSEAVVLNFIAELLPNATLMENFAGNCIYQMKKTDLTVSDLFEQMESNKKRVGIIDWGVTQTTLEDVFIRIARRDETDEELGA